MHKVNTKCKDCIFAQYDENNIQSGCKLNRLELFYNKGITMLETEEDGKVFYTLDGKFCYYCRNREWVDLYKKHLKVDEIDELYIIKQELKLQYNAIILSNDSLEDVKKTYGNLLGQSIKPLHITILKYSDDKVQDRQYVKYFRTKEFSGWKLEKMTKNRAEQHIGRDVQLVFNVHKHPYTLVIEAGKTLPANTFTKVNHQITEELFTFGVLLGNGSKFVSKTVMDYLNVLYNDVELILEDEKCQHLISHL